MHEEVLGTGNTAVVIAWGKDKVLKLFREGFPEEAIEKEYQNARFLNRLDFAKPEAHAMIHHNSRWGIVYDRVFGESLLDWVIRTHDVKGCAAMMAKVHKELLANQAACLTDYKAVLRRDMMRDALTNAQDREKTLQKLDQLYDGEILCHGDFHPGNIILSGDQAVVLDFQNICKGPALYDVARTVYLVQYTPVPPVPEGRDQILRMKRDLADLYLELMQVERCTIQEYLEVIWVARRGECPGEEQTDDPLMNPL